MHYISLNMNEEKHVFHSSDRTRMRKIMRYTALNKNEDDHALHNSSSETNNRDYIYRIYM